MKFFIKNIVKNLTKNWKATKNWNYDYFRKIIGENVVQIAVTPDGWADAVVDGIFRLPEERNMKFSDFIDKLQNGKAKEEIFYLQKQNNCLTLDYPQLASDVPNEGCYLFIFAKFYIFSFVRSLF